MNRYLPKKIQRWQVSTKRHSTSLVIREMHKNMSITIHLLEMAKNAPKLLFQVIENVGQRFFHTY